MSNLRNLPNEMISGVSDAELQWITHESNDRYIKELSDKFLKELQSPEEDYTDIENDIINEMNEAEKSNVPNSTVFSTQPWVKKFKAFLEDFKSLRSQIQ